MTQQDINIFLALVEKRNLSKAASALYMSQSTLSHRLNMLEKELNATLFTRRKDTAHWSSRPSAMILSILQSDGPPCGQRPRSFTPCMEAAPSMSALSPA